MKTLRVLIFEFPHGSIRRGASISSIGFKLRVILAFLSWRNWFWSLFARKRYSNHCHHEATSTNANSGAAPAVSSSPPSYAPPARRRGKEAETRWSLKLHHVRLLRETEATCADNPEEQESHTSGDTAACHWLHPGLADGVRRKEYRCKNDGERECPYRDDHGLNGHARPIPGCLKQDAVHNHCTADAAAKPSANDLSASHTARGTHTEQR